MSRYNPKIRLTVGDTLFLDGDRHEIVRRSDGPNRSDTFVVQYDGGETERHMDWFADQAAQADVVVIER